MKYLCVLLCVLLLTSSVQAVSISTPWNDTELWQDTWQGETVAEAGKFANFIGKGIGSWIGKIIQDDIEQKRQSVIERDPFLKLMHENYPHELEEYEELANEIKRPIDLEILIDHIEEQQEIKRKEGKEFPSEIEELKEKLKHYQQYWEEHEEEIEEYNAVGVATINTILLGILAILTKLASMGLFL